MKACNYINNGYNWANYSAWFELQVVAWVQIYFMNQSSLASFEYGVPLIMNSTMQKLTMSTVLQSIHSSVLFNRAKTIFWAIAVFEIKRNELGDLTL